MSRIKIYAIDDEYLMLHALTDTIRQVLPRAEVRGFQIEYEFLDAFVQEPCDIAFLDISMPVMSGVTIAEKLLKLKDNTNIIFVSGFSWYKAEAMDVYASAYIMKPVTVEKLQNALMHLRHPLGELKHRYRALTFGNFSLYVDGEPVTFHRRKSAELLAYLVAKIGTVVSRRELTLVLFEDEQHSLKSRKNLDNAMRTLREDLQAVRAEKLVYRGVNGLAINCDLLEADLFDFLNGNEQLYQGLFMEEYSWSEYFKSALKDKATFAAAASR